MIWAEKSADFSKTETAARALTGAGARVLLRKPVTCTSFFTNRLIAD
jgi:hypothetical protein